MKLAHFGTFEVENYGDMLFPLILEQRLSGFCDEFVHVSPVGGPPPWDDCVKTIGFDQFSRETSDVDGIVVGGGQIIRATPTPLGIYDAGGVSSFLAYPGLWLGASYIAVREGLPLCWNAPGVPRDFTPIAAQLVRWAASVTDYVAVRDEASRGALEQTTFEQDIHVVPDTALEVSGLWTKEELAEAYEHSFSRRKRRVPDRTIVCHVNSRWAGEDLTEVAARIDRICRRLDTKAILIAIGPCHGDDGVQHLVAREMKTGPLLIDKPQSLREVAACIANSEAYLGSSLHGMITACSFGRRGMLVASREDPKYSGFLRHFGLSSWLAESWDDAEKRIDGLLASPLEGWESIGGAGGPLLDRHWSRVRAALAGRRDAEPDTLRARDKHAELERLQSIGEGRYGNTRPFRALLDESLEITQVRLQKAMRRAERGRELRKELRELRKEQRTFRGKLRELEEAREELREKSQRLTTAEGEIANLTRWVDELGEAVSALPGSPRRKTGFPFGGLRRRAEERRAAMDRINAILGRFRAWREGRGG